MRSRNKIFLTGITGTAGSWLAGEALRRGNDVQVLVRAKDMSHANSRLEALQSILGEGKEQGGQLEAVPGDICQPNLGLKTGDEQIAGCSMVIHCAASTEFSENKSDLNFQTNVEGTKHILQLTEKLSAPLVYISTAYVAGSRTGVVREEELDVGQDFNNSYEQSKCRAEKLVREWAARTKMPTIILRPSILVGDSQSGRITHFRALYDLMRVFDVISNKAGREVIRIAANPEANKNFIPVDYFARTAWNLIEKNIPGTYHVTHPFPITLERLQQIFSQLFDISNITLVSEQEYYQVEATPAERMCHSAAGQYRPYMQSEPVFDRTNTDAVLDGDIEIPPEMNLAYMQKLLQYARRVKWGKVCKEVRTEKQLPDSVQSYFRVFLKEKMHQLLLPEVRSLTATFRIQFNENANQHWTMTVQKGKLEAVCENGQNSECQYFTDIPTFREIVAGQLSPQQAFFQQKVDIQGDIEVGLKVATVLAEFFHKYPYEVTI